MNLSKKCPMCNTVNDSSVEACKYCGYIFEDSSLRGMEVASANDVNPENVIPPPDVDVRPIGGSTASVSETSLPVFVISKSWKDRRNLGSFIVPIFLVILFIISDLPLFSGGSDLYSLLFLIVPALFVIPIFASSKTYEFLENSLVISGRRGIRQEIPYSDISEVRPYRGSGNSFYLLVRKQWRGIIVQGTLKSKTIDIDPYTWLSRKIQAQSKGNESSSGDNQPNESSSGDNQPNENSM